MPTDEKDNSQGPTSADLSRQFKERPSLELYAALRRKHPTAPIEVAVSGGLEWLFSNRDVLDTFKISPQLVAAALDANEHAICELSLTLMERLIERKAMMKSGRTHVVSRGMAISDNLVNCLINMMLDAMSWNDDLHIPRDLIVLIRHQTGGGVSDWEVTKEILEKRSRAVTEAIAIAAQGKTPSLREIGKMVGVNATTVMRWFPDGELKRLAELSALVRKGARKQTR